MFGHLSAEGAGIILGFAVLFVTLISMAVGAGVAYGTIKSHNRAVEKKLDEITKDHKERVDKLDEDNETVHIELFRNQKATDIKVGKIEEHLLAIDGELEKAQ